MNLWMMIRILLSLQQRIEMSEQTNSQIVSKLKTVPDLLYGYCDLREDPLFSYLKQEDYKSIIEKSFEIADGTVSKLKGQRPGQVLRAHGVAIKMRRDTAGMSEVTIQSQIIYGRNQKVVEIFCDVLQQIGEVLNGAGIEIAYEDLVELHLAHETYHFFEMSNDSRTGELLGPVHYKKMFFTRSGTLASASEIAAHYFTKKVCGIKFHPKMLDYVWMIKSGRMTEKDFLCRLAGWEEQEENNHGYIV